MKPKLACCFTGHRSIPYKTLKKLNILLTDTIRMLAAGGIRVFRTGGAVGFDTLAALKVLELRDQLGIELELILPCRDQTRGWSDRDKKYYDYILSACDRYYYISDTYTRDCMLERDRKLVEGCVRCVAYCKKNTGGTAYTMYYALKKGVEVINLADSV
ncbi:MAG: SLOG family protein [Eubacteriales bacterium]|jgi:uncharacterized phage-like protein YoqJ